MKHLGGAIAVVGSAAMLASCAASRDQAAVEHLASSAQRLEGTGTVVRGSTKKVCTLVGDLEYETQTATRSLSQSNYGVGFTDLGYPVEQSGRVWFFFGDITPENNVDPLGVTDESPGDGSNCPLVRFSKFGGAATDQAITLDGGFLWGQEVPTGVVFDATHDQFLGVFMTAHTPSQDKSADPNGPDIQGVWAVSDISSPKRFRTLQGAPQDAARFLTVAPLIVPDSQVAHIPLPPRDPGSSGNVVLFWGTGNVPSWGATGIFTGAVRLEHLETPSNWRYFTGDGWGAKSFLAQAQFSPCGRELSVTFDPTLKEYRLVYECPSNFFSTAEVPITGGGGGSPLGASLIRNIVVMRTSQRPEGIWSDAKVLFLPQHDGTPTYGDVGEGVFIHRSNLRVYQPPGNPPPPLAQLPGDLPLLADCFTDPDSRQVICDNPSPYHCATSFPSYCPPTVVQDVNDPGVGCCTRSNRCCDIAFDQIGYTGTAPHSSWGDGFTYAPYLVQPWTRDIGTRVDPRFPSGQRLFWIWSKTNPYVPVLMRTDLSYRDLDHDGIPNDEDNCPITWNPGQENCNEDSEAARSAQLGVTVPKLGDVCDPVPCPDAKTDVVGHEVKTGNCDRDSLNPTVCIGRLIRNLIDIAPVGAGIQESLIDRPVLEARATVPVLSVTDARFCQSNLEDPDPAKRYNCDDPLKMREEELTAWASAAEERGNLPQHLWHRISLTGRACDIILGKVSCLNQVTSVPLPRGDSFPLDYGVDHPVMEWRYQDDYNFWTGLQDGVRRIPPIPTALKARCEDSGRYGNGTCLDGRLWLHSQSKLGSDADNQTAPNGKPVGYHRDEIANHYIKNAPDLPFSASYGGLRERQLFFIKFTLPDPAPVWSLDKGVSLPLIREDNHLLAVFDDGRKESADFIADDALRGKLLDSSLLWLSPVEPSPFVGRSSSPVGVALKRDASQISSFVFTGPEGVLREGTLEGGGGGGGDDAGADAGADADAGEICVVTSDGLICGPASASSRMASPSSLLAPSASRTNFVALYSRAQGAVFVVGGRDATGKIVDKISTYRFELGAWDELSLKGNLGDVIAATFSWRDGRVWIIDSDPADVTHNRTRLLRVEPSTGYVEVILRSATNASGPKYDFRGLFLDMDGNVGVYASSERAQKHRIAILKERPGGFDAQMTKRRSRTLSAQPIVDLRGVALYYGPDRLPTDRSSEVDDDSIPIERTRAASRMRDLPLVPVGLAQLEELLR